MAKLTAKFVAASYAAKEEGLNGIAQLGAEALYQELTKRGYFWQAAEGRWVLPDPAEAEPASTVLRIRVWTDKEIVEDVADDVAARLEAAGFGRQEKSKVYINRPPQQNDARVYLTFTLPEKRHG